jgi:transcriptional activator SPT8
MVGLGEGVSKAGVARGWWANEVNTEGAGDAGIRREPVYSLACEGDGLWALTGTKVSDSFILRADRVVWSD